MVVMEDKVEASQRIGKIDFTVVRTDGPPDPRNSHDERVRAITRWLLAQWRLERQGVQ